MSTDDLKSRIVAFARHVGNASNPPEVSARRRGWLDHHGAPTDDGRALICALMEQDATRTIYRSVV